MSDLTGLVAGSGFAAGVNLYATVLLLGVYGRWLEPGQVPEVLTSPVVLLVAGLLTAVEFVADKVPWLDSAWDAVHLVVRPVGAAVLATVLVTPDAAMSDVVGAGVAALLALVSHSAKASTRVAVNTSPEPFSNSIVSLLEDGLVAGVVYLAVTNPALAAVVVLVLALLAVAVVVALWRLVKRVRMGLRGRSLRARREMSRR